MLDFPSKCIVNRIMPKEAFYKRLTLKNEIKEKFVSDVKRIVMEYKLTPDTLNIENSGKIKEILILSVDLKKQNLDYKIIEEIARQNSHKLLFMLKFEEKGQLAVYYHKLYKTNWATLESLSLKTKSLKLNDIWVSFIEQIALQKNITFEDNLTIDEKLKKQDTILKLQKEIDKLERLSRKEQQPKKRFALFQKLQAKRNKLEKLL